MRKEVQSWLNENYGKIGKGKLEVIGSRSGESNYNFVLEGEDGKYVLRVSKQVSRRCRLEDEQEVLEFLEEQGIEKVPRKIFFKQGTEIGTVLLETYVGEKSIDAKDFKEGRIRSLAHQIAEIHSIPVAEYNNFFSSREKPTQSLQKVYRNDFQEWSKRPFNEYLELAEEPDSRLQKFFEKQKQLLGEVPEIEVGRGLVHGDLGFNIRATGNQVFIIDWEFSRIDYQGNEILYFFEHEKLGPEQREIFLEEYMKHRELGEAFEATREIYPGFLAFNDAIWAAKRIEKEPDRDEHRERLEQKLEKLEEFYS